MGIIMLLGFMTIGFFIFPCGITLCSGIGLYYGKKQKDKQFIRCFSITLAIGLLLLAYTGCLIFYM